MFGQGFMLIELLVVITLIGVLVALPLLAAKAACEPHDACRVATIKRKAV